MLVGGVIQHKVENDVNASILRGALHAIEVGERPVHGIDVFVIGDVVAEINLRRRKARRDPDGVDSKLLQVVELGGDSGKVADSIIVAVGKAAGIDFIENGVLPPLMTGGINGGRLQS